MSLLYILAGVVVLVILILAFSGFDSDAPNPSRMIPPPMPGDAKP